MYELKNLLKAIKNSVTKDKTKIAAHKKMTVPPFITTLHVLFIRYRKQCIGEDRFHFQLTIRNQALGNLSLIATSLSRNYHHLTRTATALQITNRHRTKTCSRLISLYHAQCLK